MFRKNGNAKNVPWLIVHPTCHSFVQGGKCCWPNMLTQKFQRPKELTNSQKVFSFFLLTGRAGVCSDNQTLLRTNYSAQINGITNTWGQHKRRLATVKHIKRLNTQVGFECIRVQTLMCWGFTKGNLSHGGLCIQWRGVVIFSVTQACAQIPKSLLSLCE